MQETGDLYLFTIGQWYFTPFSKKISVKFSTTAAHLFMYIAVKFRNGSRLSRKIVELEKILYMTKGLHPNDDRKANLRKIGYYSLQHNSNVHRD